MPNGPTTPRCWKPASASWLTGVMVLQSACTIDGEVGVLVSSNMDFRSFALNYETMLLTFDGDLTQVLLDNHATAPSAANSPSTNGLGSPAQPAPRSTTSAALPRRSCKTLPELGRSTNAYHQPRFDDRIVAWRAWRLRMVTPCAVALQSARLLRQRRRLIAAEVETRRMLDIVKQRVERPNVFSH